MAEPEIKGKDKILLVILIFIVSSVNLSGQNYVDVVRLSEKSIISNARSLGMGNAYLAISDDQSAGIVNPAGLGLIKRLEINFGTSYLAYKNNTEFFGTKTGIDDNNFRFSQFGIAFPIPTYRGSMVFSLGYNKVADFTNGKKLSGFNSTNSSLIQDLTSVNDDIPFELGLSYALKDNSGNYIKDVTLINGRLFQKSDISEEGSIGSWNLSGAVEFQKNLFVGLTLNFYKGDYKRVKAYTEIDTENFYGENLLTTPGDSRTADFRAFKLSDKLDWDISGFDVKFGILYKLNKISRVAFTVKTPTDYKIKETYWVDAFSDFGEKLGFRLSEPKISKIEYHIKTPWEFSAGYAFRLNRFILSSQVTYILNKNASFKDTEFLNTGKLNNDLKNALRNSFLINLGTEYLIPGAPARLRAGFIFQQSPYEGDPSEYNKKYFTIGTGFLISELTSIDVGFAKGWWKDYGDNYGSGESRFFNDIKTTNLIINLIQRF